MFSNMHSNVGVGSNFDAKLQHDLDELAQMVDQAPPGSLDPQSSDYLFHSDSTAAKGTTTERQNSTMDDMNAHAAVGNNYTTDETASSYRPILDRDIINEDTSFKQENANPGETKEARNEGEQIDVVAQNVETIANLHIHAEQKVGIHQRAIEKITGYLGRPRFLYFILLFVLFWIGVNVWMISLGMHNFDQPPFSWLQGIISLSALLMTTLVLITQNRQNNATEERRRLDLQVNLVIEQKVTKLIALIEELREDSPQVKGRHDPEAEAMKEPVNPHEVLSSLNQMLEEAEVSKR